jgi:hypothetical protein
MTQKPAADRRIQRLALSALVLLIAWASAARADDVLEKTVHVEIAPAPLANALVQLSAESGIQIAVADVDVSHLQSKGLSGQYAVRDALQALLKNTGLSFVRVGATTVAIRAAAGGPLVAELSGKSSPNDTGPTPSSPPQDSAASTQPSLRFPDVAVLAPRAPTVQELTSDGLAQFIIHHASTRYSASVGSPTGGLLRWRGGRSETVCPETDGLDQDYSEFVSARLRAVAAYVGAPVQTDGHCGSNVHILFTTDPRRAMQWVLERGAHMLGVKFPHQMGKELDISNQHAIQGWYVTAGGGSTVLNSDPQFIGGIALQALWPRVIPTSAYVNGGDRSILAVFLAVDTNKVAGYSIGSIADYLAVAALTLVQSPDHCDPLPSILDLMAPSCASRDRSTAVTAGDLAFLKALYYRNSGLGRTLSRSAIENNMMQQLSAH